MKGEEGQEWSRMKKEWDEKEGGERRERGVR